MILRQGDSGPRVASLQAFLIGAGHLAHGQNDGAFGPITAGAVISYQRGFRLDDDGVCGPATLAAMKVQGLACGSTAPSAISGLVVEVAERLGISPVTLEAFRLVESGTTANPRALRFEPHLFLRGRPDAQIPHTPSDRGPWSLTPSETGEAAFRRAYAVDPHLAIRSTSWGLFQVLGGHLLGTHLDADGNEDPEGALVHFTAQPEAVSFRLVEAWFRANPRALRAAQADPPDLRSLVRHYNGPGQVDSYSARMADAIRRIEARA